MLQEEFLRLGDKNNIKNYLNLSSKEDFYLNIEKILSIWGALDLWLSQRKKNPHKHNLWAKKDSPEGERLLSEFDII